MSFRVGTFPSPSQHKAISVAKFLTQKFEERKMFHEELKWFLIDSHCPFKSRSQSHSDDSSMSLASLLSIFISVTERKLCKVIIFTKETLDTFFFCAIINNSLWYVTHGCDQSYGASQIHRQKSTKTVHYYLRMKKIPDISVIYYPLLMGNIKLIGLVTFYDSHDDFIFFM